ncbi:NUDIX hydrolase domain-like protein [Podospora aff. communis PSN243]|uniref:NAD(+) diphosphatase n=1 Tax=Podospora aff. communis PSN243 TaxID=3040156 RepID=A0AAV9G586_9PEZI|nr:NUDIX hydrolase domain-like protein [Podospora aff. communis PSN243]
MPTPSLPVLSHASSDNSHLTLKFGPETINYFSGSPLNRLSFLRTDHDFLQSAFSHPSASFLLMNGLAPLVLASDSAELGFVSGEEVYPLTGREPFVKTEEELIREFDSSVTRPVVVFLGVDENGSFRGHGGEKGEGFVYKEYRGVPYFGVDVTPRGTLSEVAKGVVERVKGLGMEFHESSPRHMGLHAGQAATYGYARALLDWNARNPFCAQCGQPTLSVNAGTKRVCPPTDSASGSPVERLPCATRNTVSNLSFPRTDPTVIMAVVSPDGSRILLGRQRRWPPNWYSTLAGFQEPGESIEEAVRREVWEESGVKVGRVVLHSSQPWPFPASLMIGAVGQALPGDGEKVYLGNDKELEDAKWFSTEEVREALLKGVSNLGEAAPTGYVEGKLRLPPQTAIANRLITAVVEGWWRAKI